MRFDASPVLSLGPRSFDSLQRRTEGRQRVSITLQDNRGSKFDKLGVLTGAARG